MCYLPDRRKENMMRYFKQTNEEKEVRDAQATKTVADIICDVRCNKDQALKEYALKFEHTELLTMQVSKEDIAKAYEQVDTHVVESFKKAARQIEFYAKEQLNCLKPLHIQSPIAGVELGQIGRAHV